MDKVIETAGWLGPVIEGSTGPAPRLTEPGATMPGRTSRGFLEVDGREVLVHLHRPDDGSARGAVLLLPAPGHEALVTHRFVMGLAARLVRQGFVVTRLGWTGASGSSTPGADAPGAAVRWQAEVRGVLDLLQEVTGGGTPSVVALGVAGTILVSALGGTDRSVDGLVLVAPVGKGRTYVRSRGALLGVSARAEQIPHPDTLDPSGMAALPGMRFTAEEVAEWFTLDLASSWRPGLARDVVVVGGPDAPLDRPTRALVAGAGAATWSVADLGAQLDRPAMFCVARLDLADEIAGHLASRTPQASVPTCEPALRSRAVVVPGAQPVEEELVEVAGMPGVITHAVGEPRQVLVWSATAVEPYEGVAGTWAALAREAARRGVTTVRHDLADQGERVLVDEPRDHDPYDLHAVDETVQAVEWARARFATTPSVGGLCSGAWLAMSAAARVPCRQVVGLSHETWTADPGLIDPDTLPGATPRTAGAPEPAPGLPSGVTPTPPAGATGPGDGARPAPAGRCRLGLRTGAEGLTGRGLDLVRGRAPYALRRVLAARGAVQGVEGPVRAAAARGAEVHVLLSASDALRYDQRGGDQARRRVVAAGITFEVEVDHLYDHSALTPYARERATAFVLGRLCR